jgi:hypothetical protein
LREYLEAVIKRAEAVEKEPDVLSLAFQRQKDFILDPSMFKVLHCTRRASKSYTDGIYLYYTSLKNPGCNVLFVGLTRASAKAIIWKDVLKDIDRRVGVGATFNETELTVTLPNGSVIYVTGADADENEMYKLLGRKFQLVTIDEASMYTVNLRNLVYGILGPAMTDPNAKGKRGTIVMSGTSSDFPQGLFFDITTGKEGGWKVFTWSAHDNPHVAKQWQESLDQIARDRPLYMETPQFKQWYLNEWVIDEEKLVYRFNAEKNLVKALPILSADGWSYVLGVDTGWEDDNAFVLTAYHVNDPHLYILKTFAKKKLTFDQVIQVIEGFMGDKEYAPSRVIIDGANKQGVESMRQRSSIPFEYADKQDKATFIEICNSDLVEAKIKFLDNDFNRPLWQEMLSLIWVTDGEKIKLPKKEHPNLPNHRCDAFLYSWRMGYHFHSSPAVKKVVYGSRDWYLKQSEDIWEKEREHLEKEKSLWPEDISQPYALDDLFRKN